MKIRFRSQYTLLFIFFFTKLYFCEGTCVEEDQNGRNEKKFVSVD